MDEDTSTNHDGLGSVEPPVPPHVCALSSFSHTELNYSTSTDTKWISKQGPKPNLSLSSTPGVLVVKRNCVKPTPGRVLPAGPSGGASGEGPSPAGGGAGVAASPRSQCTVRVQCTGI